MHIHLMMYMQAQMQMLHATATATAATAVTLLSHCCHTAVTLLQTATATLGSTPTPPETRRRTHMPLPTLAAPLLNHTPFAQRSTPQQAGTPDKHT
jgi:hypothetical protein